MEPIVLSEEYFLLILHFFFPENIPVLSSDKSYGLRNKPGGKCSVVDEKPFLAIVSPSIRQELDRVMWLALRQGRFAPLFE